MAAATIVALLALLVLPTLYLRDAAAERRQRGLFFQACLGLFPRYRVIQEGKHYPILTGDYRGHAVRLEPVLDTMAARKLPSLWLKVTVLRPNPARPALSFLMRPDGNEFYSPNSDMAHRRAVPASWPQNAIFCADYEGGDFTAALAPHMDLFTDARAKELVASPQGVRLVYQAAQGDRAHYLVLRQARFELLIADAAMVRALLDRALALLASLDENNDALSAQAA